MPDFTMPSLGADMESGTLVRWHVAPGDPVHRGDIIAEVETEKGLIDIECFDTGTVDRLLVEPGTRVPVGGAMAVIRAASAPTRADQSDAARRPYVPAAPSPPVATPVARNVATTLGIDLAAVTGTGPGGRVERADVERAAATGPPQSEAAPQPSTRPRVSPLARTRAAALGLDPTTIAGTGPGGAVEAADVERAGGARPAAAATRPDAPPAAPPRYADGMRHAIAAAMARSKHEIPHYYLQTRIDMTPALTWLRAENLKRPVEERWLPVVLLLKGVARALADVPDLNGHWIDDRFVPGQGVHLGFAIALKGGGLVAPAIHDVDQLTPAALMAHLQDLIPRARAGRLRSSELADATLTVTSLGDLGVDSVAGIIYPPQVALVGFGRIAEQPWAEHGMVGARSVVTASLAADHRATDGLVGGRFLDALARHLREPGVL